MHASLLSTLVVTSAATALVLAWLKYRPARVLGAWSISAQSLGGQGIGDGVVAAIGNTPLVRIKSLSELTGCEILAKVEFLNPGGSIKDRVACRIIQEALASGRLRPGGLVTEGTAGSTGISLALQANAFGCRCHVAMPDDAAEEKAAAIRALGATVERVRPVSITHRDHFVNVARRRAAEAAQSSQGGGFFADQFENPANFNAHYEGTGPEIWAQTGGRLDAFVCAAGTGGTMAGISAFLKDRSSAVRVVLIDPPGSGLYNKVARGVMYDRVEAEGLRLRNPFDTITEGIGINRLTANFARARVDEAIRGTDAEAVAMARALLAADGLFVGSSAAMNCVGAVRVAQQLGPGHRIILCDGGERHLSKFWSEKYLEKAGVLPPEWKEMAEAGGVGGSALRGTEAAAFYLRELLSGPPQGNAEAQQPLRRGGAVAGYGGGSGSVEGAGSSSAASLASASASASGAGQEGGTQ